MHRAVVPVATMLAIQAMISLCVLALGVMMPAVAKDLAIDPKLVGIFTAIIYAVAAVLALFAAGPDRAAGRGAGLPVRPADGRHRACLQRPGAGRGDRDRRGLHRRRARADQSRLGACAGPARAAPMVRHRLLDQADRRAHRLRPRGRRLPFPAGPFRLARRQPGCRSDGPRGDPGRRAAALAHRCRGRRRRAVDRHLALDPLRAGPCPAARARLVGLRLCHRPAHLHLLSGHLSLRALRSQHRPRRPPAVDLAARRHGACGW